jgi:type IV fimbrial biogenesis protein FimT
MSQLPHKTHPSPARRHAMRGLSLFEMLIVMTIVAILTTIAIPSYKYVTNANRIASELNGLLGDLQFARSEAIKEGATVEVCVSTNGTSCAAGNNVWNNGWIVLSPNSTTALRYQPAFSGTDTLTASNAVAAIPFNREGFTSTLPGATMLTLHATPATTESTRCLSVTLIGLMAIQKVDGVNCT